MGNTKKHTSKKATNNEKVEKKGFANRFFSSLDNNASKIEMLLLKYQNYIFGTFIVIIVGVLGYLGYENFVVKKKNNEAINELNQAQYYFDIAVNSQESDSLFTLALNGGEGRYGFLDVIDNYSGTPAANLAKYAAGMSYLNLGNYESAIEYLTSFNSDDVLLSTLALGAIGDAYLELEEPETAVSFYKKSIAKNENSYTTPKYLYKAAIIDIDLGNKKEALSFMKRIKKEFPESDQAKDIDIQIGFLEN